MRFGRPQAGIGRPCPLGRSPSCCPLICLKVVFGRHIIQQVSLLRLASAQGPQAGRAAVSTGAGSGRYAVHLSANRVAVGGRTAKRERDPLPSEVVARGVRGASDSVWCREPILVGTGQSLMRAIQPDPAGPRR